MMKVRLLEPLEIDPGYFIKKGKCPDYPEDIALKLIEEGKAEKFTIDLPNDCPGRNDLIKFGIDSIKKLKAVTDFDEIPGIGQKKEEKLTEYIKTL